MKKLNLALFVMSMALLAPVPAPAQSFLKKAKEKMEKVNKAVQQTNEKKSNNKKTKQPTADAPAEAAEAEENKPVEYYSDLKRGTVQRRVDYADFKETPATKHIELETNRYGLGDFHGGMAMVYISEDKSFYVSDKGEVCKPKFKMTFDYAANSDRLPRFENGRVLVRNGNDAVIMDKSGNIVKTFSGNIAQCFGFCNGAGVIVYSQPGGKAVYEWIDTNGRKIYPALSNTQDFSALISIKPRCESEGLIALSKYDAKNRYNSWGFHDKNGNWVIKPAYYSVRDFHDGLAAVQQYDESGHGGGKWGFIDKTGKTVIDFKFTNEPTSFDSGYAVVENRNGQYVVIDKTGQSVMTAGPNWELSAFSNGYAVLEGTDERGERVTFGVTDGGKKRVSYQCTDFLRRIIVNEMDGRVYYSISMNEWGLLDIPTMTSKIYGIKSEFNEGLAPVHDGYVNEKGEYVIRFTQSEF